MPAAPIGVTTPRQAVPRQLMERMFDARRRSDALFGLVRFDSIYERPIPERHRIIFYVGHLEAFDWNLLNHRESGLDLGLRSIHPEFDRLFAFGIDPVGGGLPTDPPSVWPALESVRDYVRGIRAALDQKLAEINLESRLEPPTEPVTQDGFALSTLLNVAMEHRLMHVETLAYMLHQLPLAMKVGQPASRSPALAPVVHEGIAIPAGAVKLGLARGAESFGWDNEYALHTVEVPAFAIDRYKVTNRQYLAFLADGGYDQRELWTEEDWNWKTEKAIAHPLFWKMDGDRWLYRAMFEELPLPLDWPVYVSQAEASAFARWAGKSLPTEAEWQRAAYGSADSALEGQARVYPWGNEAPSARFGNFDFYSWDPAPVSAFPEGSSAFGVDDMLGNGWEWTSTVFCAFRGFEPFPFYRGYSSDFFDGKHFVMKGGSARTAACMLRPTFRNWFQAHYQNVYAGFRCVRR